MLSIACQDLLHVVKWIVSYLYVGKAAAVGALPGVTRSVQQEIKVSNSVFLLGIYRRALFPLAFVMGTEAAFGFLGNQNSATRATDSGFCAEASVHIM